MRRIFYSALFLTVAFSSCKDDSIYLAENPVQEGEEIIFGAEKNVPDKINVLDGEGVSSRTIYDYDEASGNYNVYWVDNDSILIFCPQASQPASKSVKYGIKVNPDNPTYALSLTKAATDNAGLQWGNVDTHRFYGIYPASAVKGTAEESSTGLITMNIPVDQPASKWRIQKDDEDNVIYNGLANTDYAYMCAYKSVDKSTVEKTDTINLDFKPLTTVLEIDINGPKNGEGEVIVTSLNVEQISPDNKLIMTGDFQCEMKKEEDETDDHIGDITPIGDMNKVRSTITVPLFIQKGQIDEEGSDQGALTELGKNNLEGNYIKLKPGQKARVRMFFLRGDNLDPNNGDISGQLRIRVAPMNGEAKVKSLSTTIKVLNHQVNRVNLPAIIEDGKNYWMSNIPANTYFTELSLPGSHQSVGTEDNGDYKKYQNQGLQQQFDDGVRAFSFQTSSTGRGGVLGTGDVNQIKVFASDQLKNELYYYLQELDNILNNMPKEKREFVVVSLVYKALPLFDGGVIRDNREDWYNGLCNLLTSDSKYSEISSIYKDKIDANTTIGELSRKILLRVEAYQYDDPLPVQHFYGMVSKRPRVKDDTTSDVVAPSEYPIHSWVDNQNKQVLTMYAHDGTSIDFGSNILGEMENLAKKNEFVSEVFQKSVDLYKLNDTHNYFFHNNLGGFYCIDNGNDSNGGETEQYSLDVNTSAVYDLQKRAQDASLGVVLMNFASKKDPISIKCFSRELIQTIINNNFMFELRKDPTKPAEISSNSSRRVLTSGSNSWDN